MTTAIDRFDDEAHRRVNAHGRTTVHAGELLRHPVYTRVLHWSVSIFFVLSLLSGFAIYTPWLYRWISPLFGGGTRTRALHPHRRMAAPRGQRPRLCLRAPRGHRQDH